jgi:hypothetical protein
MTEVGEQVEYTQIGEHGDSLLAQNGARLPSLAAACLTPPMQLRAAAALLLLAAAPSASAAPHPITAADQFRRECAVTRNARPDLLRRLHAGMAGATARVPAQTWRGMSPEQQETLFWSLAYSASCAEGHRGEHVVHVLDLSGRPLARQRISTTTECHGDHTVIRPDQTIYNC